MHMHAFASVFRFIEESKMHAHLWMHIYLSKCNTLQRMLLVTTRERAKCDEKVFRLAGSKGGGLEKGWEEVRRRLG